MVEVSGEVTIDNTEKIANYYQLARRAKMQNNAADAKKYYDLIRREKPTDWEANFYALYYAAVDCVIGNIPSSSQNLANGMDTVVMLIKQGVASKADQVTAMDEVLQKSQEAVLLFYKAVWNQYDPQGYNNNPAYFREQTIPVFSIVTKLGAAAEKYFGADVAMKPIIKEILKTDVIGRSAQMSYIYTAEDANTIKTIGEKVKGYDPTYEVPTFTPKKKGCYVATAVYGSYDCPEVWTLRRFRDDTLAATWYGRAFIRTYYAVSPTLVKWFGDTAWFKNLWKPMLDRMVKKLNDSGVENTAYHDRNW